MSNGLKTENGSSSKNTTESRSSIVETNTKLEKGTALFLVKDVSLASCLISIGIKLRPDPPVTCVKKLNGEVEATFSFMPSSEDGKLSTKEMIQAYYQEMKFVEANPEHPMSYAMAVAKNLVSVKNWIDRNIPYVAFKATKDSSAVFYVAEGSKRHKNCVAKGMVQVDPQAKKI
jgi:hypothetical protein